MVIYMESYRSGATPEAPPGADETRQKEWQRSIMVCKSIVSIGPSFLHRKNSSRKLVFCI